MEGILKRRFPSSLPALILAASAAGDTVGRNTVEFMGKKDKNNGSWSGGQRWRSKEKPSYHGTTVSENEGQHQVAVMTGSEVPRGPEAS